MFPIRGMDEPASRQLAFRKSYSHIGNIRSSLGCTVPCLALTATATKSTRDTICHSLGMNNCTYVNVEANKPNIRYAVLDVNADHRKNFRWLIDELLTNEINTERHIIFCHRADDMYKLFQFFSLTMGDKQYSGTNIDTFDDTTRLFAMYHQDTDVEIQSTVKESFSQDGTIRVLFCTIAFGMGLDVKAVNNVIHYGPASDIDDYLQESGRGGRNEYVQSHALLLNPKGSTRGSNISKDMRNYIKENNKCKRVQLMEQLMDKPKALEMLHNCCSFCASKCFCLCTCPKDKCSCLKPCMLNQSIAEKSIKHVYSQNDVDSSEEDDDLQDTMCLFDEFDTDEDPNESDNIRKPIIWSSSSDEN